MGHIVSTKSDLQRLTSEVDEDDSIFADDLDCSTRDKSVSSVQKEKVSDEFSGEECPICTEDIYLRDLAQLTPCNHQFHQNCINQWLEEHNSCPNCRADVRQIVYGGEKHVPKQLTSEDSDSDYDFDDDTDVIEGEDDVVVGSLMQLLEVDDAIGSRVSPVQPTTLILGGEREGLTAWLDTSLLVDPDTGRTDLVVDICVSEDRSIRSTIDFTCPEITVECDCWWFLIRDDDIISEVSPGRRLVLRGDYVLNLKDYHFDVDGEIVSLTDQVEVAYLYDAHADTSQLTQLQYNRHARFTEILHYLRDPVTFAFDERTTQ